MIGSPSSRGCMMCAPLRTSVSIWFRSSSSVSGYDDSIFSQDQPPDARVLITRVLTDVFEIRADKSG